MSVLRLLIPLMAILFTACAQKEDTTKNTVKTGTLDPAYTFIRQMDIPKHQLDSAIRSLGTRVTEDPHYWLSIINDTTYAFWHRHLCLLALFKRHLKPGMPLTGFPEAFAHMKKPWVYQVYPQGVERKVIRGGSWKNITYYLAASDHRNDTTYLHLENQVKEQNGKIFFIEMVSDYKRPTRFFSTDGIYIGLTGNASADDLAQFFASHSTKGLEGIKVIGTAEFEVEPIYRGATTDL